MTRFEEIVVDDLPETVRNYRRTPLLPSGEDTSDFLPMHEVEKRYILRSLRPLAAIRLRGTDSRI